MRRLLPYVFFLVIFSSCGKPALNLKETYASADDNPFGGSAVKTLVKASFPDPEIVETKTQFSHIAGNWEDTTSLFISISRNFYPTGNDVRELLDFIESGNTAFIAASFIDTALLSEFNVALVNFNMFFNNNSQAFRQTSVSLGNALQSPENFGYYYYPFSNYFSAYDSEISRVISYNENGVANCLVFFSGKGKLILHCDPRAFSNYFLLQKNNYRYLSSVLSVAATPGKIYWDKYYQLRGQPRQRGSGSALQEIMKYPALKAALWIFISLMLLYILFNLKRRQRVIPVIKKNENSSIAFAETISRLYLQQKDHKSIAEKMIVYFYEHIRSSYFINRSASPAFIPVLSKKSGVPENLVMALFKTIENIRQAPQISEQDLLLLNDQIEQFYKMKQ